MEKGFFGLCKNEATFHRLWKVVANKADLYLNEIRENIRLFMVRSTLDLATGCTVNGFV